MNFENVEDIYPLTPSQQGMLYASVARARHPMFVEQYSVGLDGALNPDALHAAWDSLVSRHPVLRTMFLWEDLDEPLQLVRQHVTLPWQEHDLRVLDPVGREQAFARFCEQDRATAFDLRQAPQVRCALFRFDESRWRLVCSYHHILMDGWCNQLVLEELMAGLRGEAPAMPAPRYSEYVEWLSRRDVGAAEAFWRKRLAGLREPATLVSGGAEGSHEELRLALDGASSSALQALAREHKLTLNTVVQGSWALVLSHALQRPDVCFGITVSGRPAELPGIEQALGLFINTVPLPVRLDAAAGLWPWLRALQAGQQEQRTHEFCTPGQIHAWSPAPPARALFDTVMVFENEGTDSQAADADGGLRLERFEFSGARTGYPFVLMVFPGHEIGFRCVFQSGKIDADAAGRLLGWCLEVMKNIATGADSIAAALAGIKGDLGLVPAAPGEHRGTAPRTITETRVLELWEQALETGSLGVEDDFFQLGGHSLLAAQLMQRISKAFEVDVRPSTLFEQRTIAALARHIDDLRGDGGHALPALPSLVPAPEQAGEPFPLTDVQQAYLLGRDAHFGLGNVATHLYFEIDYDSLDLDRYNAAWRRLIARHPMLRMVVLPDGLQHVLAEVPHFEISLHEMGQETPAQAERILAGIRATMSHQILAAGRWPLFDIRAARGFGANPARTRLHFSFDLLIADAWSMRILERELAALYRDPEAPLAPLEISFRDLVLAERALRGGPLFERARAYWLERIDTLPRPPQLALAARPETVERPTFRRVRGVLAADDHALLRRRAAEHGLTVSAVLLGAYARVLARWSQGGSFCLNLTLFNRLPLHPQVNDVVGDFTSLSLLEVHERGAPFAAQVLAIQRQLWKDLDQRYFSGVEVLRELARRRGGMQAAGMPVVFTSALNLGAAAAEPASAEGVEWGYGISQTPQVWLDHQVFEQGGQLVFNWDAVEALFPASVVEGMSEMHLALLEGLARDGAAWQRSATLPLPRAEQARRSALNATAAPRPPVLLDDLFWTSLARDPARLALVASERTFSYAELGAQAQRVSAALLAHGVAPGAPVGILMAKGWRQAAAVLGVLGAGAAYLPLDADWPALRRDQVLRDARARLVLTADGWPDGAAPEGVTALAFDALPAADGPRRRACAGQPAYIMYTSGSTGRPKGVCMDHGAVVNTILDINRRLQAHPDDRVLTLSALHFDLSVYDLFGMWAAGGAVVMPEAARARDPGHWWECLEAHGVTIWNTVPALLELLLDHPQGRAGTAAPRAALLSGDWIGLDLPMRARQRWPGLAVCGLGGATEAAIWSVFEPIGELDGDWASIPYGAPLANQQVHVLDAGMAPCPDGVSGELYIGGDGLALCYWNDPARTAERFVPAAGGQRLYRTGDLARFHADGRLEFLGRADTQVKIHGHRIELGEIEAALRTHPQVGGAAVVALGQPGQARQLAAYVVPRDGVLGAGLAQGVQSVGEAALPSGVTPLLTGERERAEFKLRQPGLRSFPLGRRVIALERPAEEEVREAYLARQSYRSWLAGSPAPGTLAALFAEPGSSAAFVEADSFDALGTILGCMTQLRLEDKPLPKYRYPSASSLYPVQGYLEIPPSSGTGLPAGRYYYDPAKHRLVMLAPQASAATADGPDFTVFLAADTDAIRPMYAELSERFCFLEAGYMRHLLDGAAHASGFSLRPLEQMPSVASFGLGEKHLALAALAAVPAHRAAPDRDPAQLRIFVHVKEGAHHDGGGTLYRCEGGSLTPLAPPGGGWPGASSLADAFGPNRAMFADAAFAVFIMGRREEEGAARAVDLIAAGRLGQQWMEAAPGLDLGLCPIGDIGRGPLDEQLGRDAGWEFLHGFVGGTIDPAQRGRWLEDKPRQQSQNLAQALRAYLESLLPASMIPIAYTGIERLPLSANGKVDRSKLPSIEVAVPERPAFVAPRDATEQAIAAIWKELLGVDTVGIHDDFFAIGGDSLVATQLVSRLGHEFGVELEIAMVFRNPTIAALSRLTAAVEY